MITPSRTQTICMAIAQTILWSSGFYIFAALLPYWQADRGWSIAEMTTAFTVSCLLSAALSPLSGKLIDLGKGRIVLMAGCVLVGGGLAGMTSVIHYWQFFVMWTFLGVGMSCCLYDACFAYITHTQKTGVKQSITTITLFAGFASTITFPLAGWLAHHGSWQISCWVFSGLVMGVAFPCLWVATRRESKIISDNVELSGHEDRGTRALLLSMKFWLITLVFTAIGSQHAVLICHSLPLFQDRGLSLQSATFLAACFGPMQVLGRVVVMVTQHRWSPLYLSMMICMVLSVSTIVLLMVHDGGAWMVVFVVLQGAGYGINSIVRPLVVADAFGRERFGVINGWVAVVMTGAVALTPTIAALLLPLGGYDGVLVFCLVLVVGGLMAGAGLVRTDRQQPRFQAIK